MQFGKRIGPLARRVAAMQIPVYAGNASFFLLLSVFPVVSLLLSLLPYTPLTLDHLLAFCEDFAPDWTLRALEFFVRTLYASSSAAIISASRPELPKTPAALSNRAKFSCFRIPAGMVQ